MRSLVQHQSTDGYQVLVTLLTKICQKFVDFLCSVEVRLVSQKQIQWYAFNDLWAHRQTSWSAKGEWAWLSGSSSSINQAGDYPSGYPGGICVPYQLVQTTV